jgi:hypothetical protein
MVGVAPDVRLARKCLLELQRLLVQGVGLGAQRVAERAQPEPLADTIKQLYVELALQVGEGPTDGGLRHAEFAGRAADALTARHRQEDFELTEREAHGASLSAEPNWHYGISRFPDELAEL